MDVIDQLVGDLRPESCVFCRLEAREPWRIQKSDSKTAPFYAVLSGKLRLVCSTKIYELVAGDFLVLPGGAAHEVMGIHSLVTPSIPLLTLFAHAGIERWRPGMRYRTVRLAWGGAGEECVFLIGLFYFGEPRANPLLAALPDVLTLESTHFSHDNLNSPFNGIQQELQMERPGSSMVVARYVELLLIEALRKHLETSFENDKGWIRGISDPCVGRALSMLHAAPAEAWTLKLLAERAGCSRAVLARRFQALLGEGALAYLTRWRMHIAAGLLLRNAESIATVACQVGYQPEAFAHAFRRWSGMSPSRYRARITRS